MRSIHPLFVRSVLVSLLIAGCAHEVVWLGDEPPVILAPEPPAPLTMALSVQSFQATGVREAGLVERFANDLRNARIFQGIMYPVPADVDPRWELRLLVRDSAQEPNANFWKSIFASWIPGGLGVYFENDYTLEVEALVTRNDEVVRTYRATGPIRNRYQSYANKLALDAEAVELVVERTTRTILSALASDAVVLAREDRARTSR